jgi:hypothetical protein
MNLTLAIIAQHIREIDPAYIVTYHHSIKTPGYHIININEDNPGRMSITIDETTLKIEDATLITFYETKTIDLNDPKSLTKLEEILQDFFQLSHHYQTEYSLAQFHE